MPAQKQKGFTLVELLVVISIIAILSVLGITLFTNVQKSARNTQRISHLKSISTALEIYYNNPANNFRYPNTTAEWRSECFTWGSYAPENVIPGLVSGGYLKEFPKDPGMNVGTSRSCYMYQSNGTDYVLLDHDIEEFSASDYLKPPSLVDPLRDSGVDGCIVDGTGPWSWKVSSPGGRCW